MLASEADRVGVLAILCDQEDLNLEAGAPTSSARSGW